MPPLRIEWSDEARANVRRLDRSTAMRIFQGVLHHGRTGTGDVEPLHGGLSGAFRLRIGDYRVIFRVVNDVMRIAGVRHRSEAYR